MTYQAPKFAVGDKVEFQRATGVGSRFAPTAGVVVAVLPRRKVDILEIRTSTGVVHRRRASLVTPLKE